MDFKKTGKITEYSAGVTEALLLIENLIAHKKNHDHCAEIMSDYIFLEKKIDLRNKISKHTVHPTLTLIQEFQLIVALSEFFARPGPDAIRNTVFLSLFGSTTGTHRERARILFKLISTAIAASIAPILCAAGTLMQQLGPTSVASIELANSLVQDFIIFSGKCSEKLKSLPMIAPRFAINLMTSVTELYLNDYKPSNGPMMVPPDMLYELFSEWLTENPSLCLTVQPPLALPAGAIAMPVVTPLAGFIRWCSLSPIYVSPNAYSKLHLAILQSFLQTPQSTVPPAALNVQHLMSTITSINNYVALNLSKPQCKPIEQDERLQTSLERFGQAIQLALSTHLLSGNVSQFLCRLETLPKNNFLQIVIKTQRANLL